MMNIHIPGHGARRTAIVPVETYAEASAVYSAARDASGEGASTFRDGVVKDANGRTMARVSYNGRVWPPGPYVEGAVPLYDNRRAAYDAA